VAVAVVGQVEVLLVSALRRLWLYESAYGFTTLRLYAHAYMVAVALFLGMLGWGLARGLTAGGWPDGRPESPPSRWPP
jgi:hypothetical protein